MRRPLRIEDLARWQLQHAFLEIVREVEPDVLRDLAGLVHLVPRLPGGSLTNWPPELVAWARRWYLSESWVLRRAANTLRYWKKGTATREVRG